MPAPRKYTPAEEDDGASPEILYDEEQEKKNKALRSKRGVIPPEPRGSRHTSAPEVGKKFTRTRGGPKCNEKATCFCGVVMRAGSPAFIAHYKHFPQLCRKRAGP